MCGFKVGSRLRCLLKWWWILQWLTSGQDRCPNIAPAWAGEPVLSVRCGPGPLGPWTLLWTTVACLRQKGEWVGWGGGEKLFYPYGVDLALWALEHSCERLWPVYDRWVGGGGSREAVLSVQRGPGPLDPWTLLWMTVTGLCQKGEWTGFLGGRVVWGWRGVGRGWGGRSCSISMAWTWPSGPMNTPMNDCGLSVTERWVDSWGGGRGVGVRFCQYGVDLAL